MDYSVVRTGIEEGDVLAFHFDPGSIFSQLISFRTRSRVSHVGFAVKVHGRVCVIEAIEGRGVRVFPLSMVLKQGRKVDWYHTDVPRTSWRWTISNEALSHWGRKYASPWQFVRSFGLVTRWVCDRLGVARDTNDKRFFCSEFVVSCLKRSGIMIDGDSALMSPGDVIELPCLVRRGTLEWITNSKQKS